MRNMEIVILAVAAISLIASFVTLYLTYAWKIKVHQNYTEIDACYHAYYLEARNDVAQLTDKLYELRKSFADAGVETLKVRTADHDKAIESIRKDLLDLQVLSGTLPTAAGTMRQEVENALEALNKVQSSYLETRAIVDKSKEQVEALAKAYSGMHFTSLEFEHLRDKVNDMSAYVKKLGKPESAV